MYMNNRLTILFFSDIHVGDGTPENQDLVLDEFVKDCKKQLKGDNGDLYALIGGDLVFEADKAEQYTEFHDKVIKELVNIGFDLSHIICVQGNHDGQKAVVADKSLSYVPAVERKYQEADFNSLLDQDSTTVDKFKNFDDYVKSSLSIPEYNNRFYVVKLSNDWNLCCLNSSLSSFSAYKEKKDLGYLGIDTRNLQKWLLNNHGKKKIMMLHHPQSWLMDWAATALNTIIKKEFSLVLTGHTHDQDLLCNKNGGDSYIHCQAPQLFTSKEDMTLGYCIIHIVDDEVTNIIYRQWSNKRYRFNPGADFTESEDGIVTFVEEKQSDQSAKAQEMLIEDKVMIILQSELNSKMVVYNDQPVVWVSRFLSKNRVDKMSKIKEKDMLKEEDIISNPRDVIVLSPSQYGLTCYGIHFLITAWQSYKQFGLFVPGDVLKKSKFEGYINNRLQEFDKDVDDVKWVVIDDWIVSKKDSKIFLSIVKDKFKQASILLMSPRIERYFKDNPDISVREEGFESLYMTPIQRDGVRSIVKAFNNKRYIEEEEKVLKRVNDDIRDFNMHRTPLNCITLLEVFNNSAFQDNPVNRTEVLERVLRIIFDNHKVPTYRSSVPDMKDCQFVLGYFCKQMILNDADVFTEEKFKSILNKYCDDNGITLDISYLFEILVANQIITRYFEYYCFRFTYWVYYFAAMQMHNGDNDLIDFIITKKNYIHYPEILEFYTGKDRRREDAVRFMSEDLSKATTSVRQKVGWPGDLNLFNFLKCQQSEGQTQKVIDYLETGVKRSNVPSELKDTFEDVAYSPARAFDQSVRKFLEDYSVNYLIQSIHIASKTFRNSDYVDRNSKDALLDSILEGWKMMVQIIWTIAKPLVVHRNIGYDDTHFELVDETLKEGDSLDDQLLRVIVSVPMNIMAYYKNDMYSDKNGKTILQTFERESDKIRKYLLACVIIMERPMGWDQYISRYMAQVGQTSFYLGNLKDLMLFIYNNYEIDASDEASLKLLIKKAVWKLEKGDNHPSPKDLSLVRFVKNNESKEDAND